MEKVLTIDGKEVRLKSTAATPLRYKAQFGRDYFADLIRLSKLADLRQADGSLNHNALDGVDFEIFYNIIWAMAKTADKDLPDPITWLDGFEVFPIMEIIPQVQDLILANLQTTKGRKK